MSEYKIAKSLRWVCNQIPNDLGDSNEEKMLKCIKLYCQQGAETIEEFEKRIKNSVLVELPCKVGDTVYIACKKIGKFRKWLIKKLGGIDARETPQVIINECSKNIINLESKAILENYKKEFVTETMAKRHLKDELWKQLTPYISYYSTYDLKRLATVYKARLTIVAEVQNER